MGEVPPPVPCERKPEVQIWLKSKMDSKSISMKINAQLNLSLILSHCGSLHVRKMKLFANKLP